MKIGVFFGGQSREREISFAGGRTVYDNLDKSIFEPIPIFVDSLGNFILLEWQYLYKGTIRDFYPPAQYIPEEVGPHQIYIESLHNISLSELDELINKVGKKIQPYQFKEIFDFAFLALHGPYGEDGNLQGILEWHNIPYSGSGILPSAIGIDKIVQKKLFNAWQMPSPKYTSLNYSDWQKDQANIYSKIKEEIGLPLVIKAPHQGSSIGVAILKDDNLELFIEKVNQCFFIKTLQLATWKAFTAQQKKEYVTKLTDIRDGLGMPIITKEKTFWHPAQIIHWLNNEAQEETVSFCANNTEEQILIEAFIEGKEFSCIVIQQEDGSPMALPPTEIIKGNELFDYRSKYLPGMSHKVTPIDLPENAIQNIRTSCEQLFSLLQANVYARIDGFITSDNTIYLNDPNTTSGMLPSSFFFHQAAEIGLNPSQFLTYIIRTSLSERIKTGKNNILLKQLLSKLDEQVLQLNQSQQEKKRVGVIMGGFSSERHISVESGRNIFEKLSASTEYLPIPIFLTGDENKHQLYIIPINIMLKDNADDIKHKITHHTTIHPALQQIVNEASKITEKYTGEKMITLTSIQYKDLPKYIDVAFIALHGRPGEDGAVQQELEKIGIPYNGSSVETSKITINKYETNEILRKHGIKVAHHDLVYKKDWLANPDKEVNKIEQLFSYPLIVKPADDGCSSAVKKIKNSSELSAFANLIFRDQETLSTKDSLLLNLQPNEEFPQKDYFLIEELIEKGEAQHFLEITGGLLTKFDQDGNLVYEIFEPSEALATGDVLSLEEKFLAGEGQNITPARYDKTPEKNYTIASQVKEELKKVAEILRIEGYARIDAFVKIYDNKKPDIYIIEINSLPGMTPATCIFHQCALNGYKPYDFIKAILEYGILNKKINV